jgi:hypothetical protein
VVSIKTVYRGRTLFYLESEYRRDITENGLLGFVVFTNVNTVSGSGTLFSSWHPAAGTGLRIKFNKGSNTNIGVDYAGSKGYSSLIFSLGEAFLISGYFSTLIAAGKVFLYFRYTRL